MQISFFFFFNGYSFILFCNVNWKIKTMHGAYATGDYENYEIPEMS